MAQTTRVENCSVFCCSTFQCVSNGSVRVAARSSNISTADSNFCQVGVDVDNKRGRVVIFSALDNLVKGAAGAAVQNMNVMFGLPEETGLTMLGMHP